MNNDDIKVETKIDSGFFVSSTLDELIEHFQQLKNEYVSGDDLVIDHTIEFEFEHEDGIPVMFLYIRKHKTESEKAETSKREKQYNKLVQNSEKNQLKELMEKYPQEVSKWLINNPNK